MPQPSAPSSSFYSSFYNLERRLFAPVDIGWLLWFRVLLGALLLWEVWLFFRHGLIERYYVEPQFHFTYLGFEWVRPWPTPGMHIHFAALGALAACILLGIAARAAAFLFGLGFLYVFLLDKARYMNHFYLVILLCGLLSLMPAGGGWSADAWLRPALRRTHVPAWTLSVLRFQFAVVYLFAGIAKLHPDFLSGRVLGLMLSYKEHVRWLWPLAEVRWFPMLLSHAALLLDLAVVPLLLWRRTRCGALLAAVCFHGVNAFLFDIDVFPWLMIGGTAILFFPDRLPRWGRGAVPDRTTPSPAGGRWRRRRLIVYGLAAYALVQVSVPLRHLVYPGDAAWTDEGHLFAWRMLMRVKVGYPPRFPVTYVRDGRLYRTEIPRQPDEVWFRHWQARKMLLDPDMVLQYVHLHVRSLRKSGAQQIDIRAVVPVSLNGRAPALLIDPGVNLAVVPRGLGPKTWVLPAPGGAGPRDGLAREAARGAGEAAAGIQPKSVAAPVEKDCKRRVAALMCVN